jgi:polyketide cyclase/dehydrase/lipid transport protein
MKFLKTAGIVVAALIVLCLVIGLFLPRQWDVERSILVNAPRSKIHPWVESPARWNDWFALEEMKSDPNYRVSTSGPEKGVGATYEWSGGASGRGRIVIAESDVRSGVQFDEWIEVDATEPKNGTGRIVYSDAPDGSTRVTWSDQGTLPPVIGGYLRGLVNASMAKAFEKGLVNLKAKGEAR